MPILGAIPDGHGANPVVLALMGLVPLIAATCIARAVRRAVSSGFLLRVGGGCGQCGSGRTRAGHRLRRSPVAAPAAGTCGRLARRHGKWGLAVAAVLAILAVLAVSVLGAWNHLFPPVFDDGDGAADTTPACDLVAGSR